MYIKKFIVVFPVPDIADVFNFYHLNEVFIDKTNMELD